MSDTCSPALFRIFAFGIGRENLQCTFTPPGQRHSGERGEPASLSWHGLTPPQGDTRGPLHDDHLQMDKTLENRIGIWGSEHNGQDERERKGGKRERERERERKQGARRLSESKPCGDCSFHHAGRPHGPALLCSEPPNPGDLECKYLTAASGSDVTYFHHLNMHYLHETAPTDTMKKRAVGWMFWEGLILLCCFC